MPIAKPIFQRAAGRLRGLAFRWRKVLAGAGVLMIAIGMSGFLARESLAKWAELRVRHSMAKEGIFYSFERAEVTAGGIIVTNPALYGDAGWEHPLAQWRGEVRVGVPWGKILTQGLKVDLAVQSRDAILTVFAGKEESMPLQGCGVDLVIGADGKVRIRQAAGKVADLQIAVSGGWRVDGKKASASPPDFSEVRRLWPWLQCHSSAPGAVVRMEVVLSPGEEPDTSGNRGVMTLEGGDFDWRGMAVTSCKGRAVFTAGRMDLETFQLTGKSGEVLAEGYYDGAKGEWGIGKLDSTLDPLSLAMIGQGSAPEFLQKLTTESAPHLQGTDLVINISDPGLSIGRLVSGTPWKMNLRVQRDGETKVEPVAVTELEMAMGDRKFRLLPLKLSLLGGQAELSAEWEAGQRWQESAVTGVLNLKYQDGGGQAKGRFQPGSGQLHLDSVQCALDLVGWYNRIPGLPASGMQSGETPAFTGSEVVVDFKTPERSRGKFHFERGGMSFTKATGEVYEFAGMVGGVSLENGDWRMEDMQFDLSGYRHVLNGRLRTLEANNRYEGAYAAIREGRRMDITGEWDLANDRGKFSTFSSELDIVEWLARMPFTSRSAGVAGAARTWEFTEPPRVEAENVVLDVHRPELNNIDGRLAGEGTVRLKPVGGGKGFPVRTYPLSFSMHEGVLRSDDLDFEALGARWKGGWRDEPVTDGPGEYRFSVDQAGRKAEIELQVNHAGSEVMVRRLESEVDFADMLRRMPEVDVGILADIDLKKPPRISMAPFHIDLKNPASGTYDIKLSEGVDFDWRLEGRVLPVRGLIGNFRWEGGKLEARDTVAEVFGGKTMADFWIQPLEKGTPLLGTFSTAGMSVPQLYLFLNKPETDETRVRNGQGDRKSIPRQARGLLDASYKGRAGSGPAQFTGEGSLAISEGMFYSLPLLGPLDLIFGKIFATYRLDQAKDMHSNFTVAGGIAESRDFRINGRTTKITGEGVVDFNRDLIDARFRGNLRGLAGVLTSPLSRILEVKVDGELNDRRQGLRYLRVPGTSKADGKIGRPD